VDGSMRKAHDMWLFTNRNCLVFDEEGKQISEYQAAISCYTLDKNLAQKATEEAVEFHIGKFHKWEHEITKDEMQYLLGLKEEKGLSAKERGILERSMKKYDKALKELSK
jgi:hypothetical protein